MDSLRQWAELNGFRINQNLDLVKDQSGANIGIATDQIKPNQVLIECPERYFFGPKNARELFGQIPQGKAGQIYTKMAFLQEFHKKNKSRWWPYIQQLPQTARDILPIFFDDKCQQLIQDTNLSSELPEKLNMWKKEYNDFIINHPGMTFPVTEDEFIWVSAIFTSRSFPAKLCYPEESTCSSMLIPLVDFLNHRPLYPVEWNAVGDRFQIINSENIDKGQQIFNNYGAKGNEELLLGYGFCIENNPFDNVPLKLAVSESVAAYCNNHNVNLPDNGIFYLAKSEKSPVPEGLIDVFTATISNQRGYTFGSRISKVCGYEMLKSALMAKSQKITSLTAPFDPLDRNQIYACWYTKGVRQIYSFALDFCCQKIKEILNNDRILALDADHLDPRVINAGLDYLKMENMNQVIESDAEDEILLMQLTSNILTNKESRISLEETCPEQMTNYKDYYDNWTGILKEFSGPQWTLEHLSQIGQIFESKASLLTYQDDQRRSRSRILIDFDS